VSLLNRCLEGLLGKWASAMFLEKTMNIVDIVKCLCLTCDISNIFVLLDASVSSTTNQLVT